MGILSFVEYTLPYMKVKNGINYRKADHQQQFKPISVCQQETKLLIERLSRNYINREGKDKDVAATERKSTPNESTIPDET